MSLNDNKMINACAVVKEILPSSSAWCGENIDVVRTHSLITILYLYEVNK